LLGNLKRRNRSTLRCMADTEIGSPSRAER
jgi:hypothetical protein